MYWWLKSRHVNRQQSESRGGAAEAEKSELSVLAGDKSQLSLSGNAVCTPWLRISLPTSASATPLTCRTVTLLKYCKHAGMSCLQSGSALPNLAPHGRTDRMELNYSLFRLCGLQLIGCFTHKHFHFIFILYSCETWTRMIKIPACSHLFIVSVHPARSITFTNNNI